MSQEKSVPGGITHSYDLGDGLSVTINKPTNPALESLITFKRGEEYFSFFGKQLNKMMQKFVEHKLVGRIYTREEKLEQLQEEIMQIEPEAFVCLRRPDECYGVEVGSRVVLSFSRVRDILEKVEKYFPDEPHFLLTG